MGFKGTWNGQEVSIHSPLCKRDFTQEEADRLFAGDELYLTGFVSRKGNTFDSWVRIAPHTDDNGEERLGVEFDFGRLPKTFHGHTFTDDELKRLEAGEPVAAYDLISKKGSTYAAWLRKSRKEEGRLDMDFDTFLPPHEGMSFMGHTFTKAEADELNAGRAVDVDDLYSRRKGKEFAATLAVEGEGDKRRISMQF